MVKLIRLTTNDDNCIFDNTFNQDIQLKPNSKIALKNFSCEIDTQQFIINTSNNTLRYQITNAIKEVRLSKGIYTRSNINNLLYDMTLQLNKSLTLTGAQFGKQFLVSRKDAKTNILTKQGSIDSYLTDQKRANVEYIPSETINNKQIKEIYQRNDGIRGSNDSFMYINKAVCKGAGVVNIKLGTLPNPTGNGFMLGITKKLITGVSPTIRLEDIDYGINVKSVVVDDITLNKIYFITNGTIVDSDENINYVADFNENNDEYFIIIEEGKIKLKVYRKVGEIDKEILLFDDNYDGITDYYPVLIFQGNVADDNVRVRMFRFTPDPFYSNIVNVENVILDETLELIAKPTPATRASKHSFEIVDNELATFLGFKNKRIPKTGFDIVKNFDIYSDFEFLPSDVSDSFYVELLNIPLQSYNADRKQRQNILHTIVNSNVNNDRVDYTAPYPLYIDINNDKDLTLRNIRARILKDDGAPVSVNGKSQLTILID